MTARPILFGACITFVGCQAATAAPAKTEEPAPIVVAINAPAVSERATSVAVDPNGPAPDPAATVGDRTSPQYASDGSPATVRQEGNKLKLAAPVLFEVGKTVLRRESDVTLEALHGYLDSKPFITLMRIEGHSDSQGSSALNLTLSGERARAIRDWLIRNGVRPSRLIAVGFGEMKPIADNNTAEGRAQNRRMEFVIVEAGGKPWLGADPVGGGTVFGPNPR